MQTKLNKLVLSLSVIILAGCQGSTQSNGTTPTNQALTLNEYVSMLDYTPNNTVSKANATIQGGASYQQSFTASESVTLSSVDVMFYDEGNCLGNALSNITMNANNPMAPTTMPAGTYRSTNVSNLALANRFQPIDGDGGADAEFSRTKSIKFVYHYNEAPGVSEMCLANSDNSNQERISDVGADTYCTTGSSCGFSKAYNINLQFEVAGSGVRGWPSYVAQGGVLIDYTYYDPSLAVAEYNQRPVDAIFTYDNGEGSAALVAPTITLAAVKGAQGITTNNGKYTRPVIVHYTLNQSEGLDPAPLAETEMAKHFTKLIYNVQTMEHFYDASTNPYPGSFVMNPDTLGEIQLHNGTASGQPFSGTFNVNEAIHTAVCATSNEFTWNVPYAAGGGTYNGTGTAINVFFNILTTAPWQDAGVQTWNANFQPVVYNNCNSTTPITSGIEIPTFTNDFKGWIQATNWIFKEFGPHTTFGWQENMWVIAPGGTWVHNYNLSNNDIDTQYGLPVADWLSAEGVFNGTYRPDFVVFDKYERDAYELTPNNTFNNGWLWGVTEFENYLRYIKYVTANVGTDQSGQPYYAMLWQIPGGHLQYEDETSLNTEHASTEPDAIFGDTNLTENFANVKPTLLGTSGGSYGSLSSSYSLTPYVGLPASTLLLRSPYTEWHVNRMDQLASARVFSVLWGGGNTTSVGTKPWNDPWLSNKIIDYYTHPTNIK